MSGFHHCAKCAVQSPRRYRQHLLELGWEPRLIAQGGHIEELWVCPTCQAREAESLSHLDAEMSKHG